jgi:ORF6N domain
VLFFSNPRGSRPIDLACASSPGVWPSRRAELGLPGVVVKPELLPLEHVERVILVLRGYRVILDTDLAAMYGVEVKALNQAVKRSAGRFPEDFMFRLTSREHAFLRSQPVTLKKGRGQHRKYLPLAFTEQGVAMLSSVLRSARAVQVNIEIMRAFVRLRQMLQSNADLAKKLDALEKKYDSQFRVVFDAIRELMGPQARPKRPIGFRASRT